MKQNYKYFKPYKKQKNIYQLKNWKYKNASQQERRDNCFDKKHVRAKRNPKNLISDWDDWAPSRLNGKSWKDFTKKSKQYM